MITDWSFMSMFEVPLLKTASCAAEEPGHTAAKDGEVAASSSFLFVKHMPQIIDRLRTDVAGAVFVEKLAQARMKALQQAAASNAMDDHADNQAKIQDINDLLHPKKRAKKSQQPKRKAAAKKSAQAPAATAAEDELEADINVDGLGTTRNRWWIDDVLLGLAHAAGGSFAATKILRDS